MTSSTDGLYSEATEAKRAARLAPHHEFFCRQNRQRAVLRLQE
ncbi:hypothetical protein [Acetobacter indonesiensis]|nr:hypothetical protein [Acetobacter indonesiensis]